ncbi:hypothetical protein [Nocardioides antri]|uniref:Uncharacterized protein n=1 Tax=Nocardioides antri TaxID=2607659 RepID=A0A5B1M4Z4_9ACTN|nr:hypothetical protein [Nocardioides antri]KAA1427209.1 hypothetical protein F0U47_06805 [Nocardioides antri]
MSWRRIVVTLLTTVAIGTGLQAVTVAPAAAECPHDPWCVDTGGNGGSVQVQFHGTAVSSTGGGSSTSVPPDCWFADGLPLEPALAQRQILALLEWLIPLLRLPLAPVSEYRAALDAHPVGGPDYDQWKWYFLKCRPGFNFTSDEAMSVGETTEWYGQQVARLDLLLKDGTPTPGAVSVETLLEVAQDAFTIPEPEVQQNPTAEQFDDATLVNLDTWFWSDTAQRNYTITATAGPVSVTLSAENAGYTLTSPYGSTSCTYEQFTTAWSPELDGNPDAGCRLTFDRPSPEGSAGHEVQVTSQWDVTWTATGITGTNTLDPLTPSSTFNVPVIEQGALVID